MRLLLLVFGGQPAPQAYVRLALDQVRPRPPKQMEIVLPSKPCWGWIWSIGKSCNHLLTRHLSCVSKLHLFCTRLFLRHSIQGLRDWVSPGFPRDFSLRTISIMSLLFAFYASNKYLILASLWAVLCASCLYGFALSCSNKTLLFKTTICQLPIGEENQEQLRMKALIYL